MDTLEKDKISNNSSNVSSSTEDESSAIVTTVQFKDQTLYCCAKIREKHFLYLWVSSQLGIQGTDLSSPFGPVWSADRIGSKKIILGRSPWIPGDSSSQKQTVQF